MKKRVIAVLTAVLMTASLAGCGSGKLSNDYVTVNKYKGLEVTEVAKNEVSDDSVEQEIQSRLEAAAPEQDVTDRAAQSGDWVNIDYTGTLDGVAFDGGTATGYDLELGSGSFIGASGDYQGFEDQIVGHNTGEEFDITVQFPENYQSSDLAGKPANFHIVLNKIYQKVTPELTDEWVANNSESSKTVDEYKEEVKNSLQEQQDDSGNSQLKQEVQTALLDQIEVNKYPDGAVDEQVKQANDYYTQIAQMYGVELSDFITTYLKMTEDQFNKKIEDSAKQAVQLEEAVIVLSILDCRVSAGSMTDAHHHRMQRIQYAEHDDNAECRSPGSTARNNQQRRNAGADRIECVHEVEPSGVPLRGVHQQPQTNERHRAEANVALSCAEVSRQITGRQTGNKISGRLDRQHQAAEAVIQPVFSGDLRQHCSNHRHGDAHAHLTGADIAKQTFIL